MKLHQASAFVVILVSLAAGLAHAEEHVNVAIKLFQFQPKTIEIKTGTIVEWENGDAIDHSVTAGEPGKQSPDFDSGFFRKGDRFEHVFTAKGTYDYFCRRHSSMRGKIVVTE